MFGLARKVNGQRFGRGITITNFILQFELQLINDFLILDWFVIGIQNQKRVQGKITG